MKLKKALILRLLDGHRLMAIATNRPDGWPQVTTVGYVNDGFMLYCFIAPNSQKRANIELDPRVSISIASDSDRPLDITGLSLAARASVVENVEEYAYVSRLRLARHPEYAASAATLAIEPAAGRASPQPSPSRAVLLRLAPELISLIDYSQGFGHSDIVTFSQTDLDILAATHNHRWDAHAG